MNSQPQYIQRIQTELRWILEKSGVAARLITGNNQYFVFYPSLKTSGEKVGLPASVDVLVPVPSGYPASPIDMPCLPSDSVLIPHVVGGSNPQATFKIEDRDWKMLSYHPYNGGGGATWDSMHHGFHDYYHHLYTWLNNLK
jgi:hypothetical protein